MSPSRKHHNPFKNRRGTSSASRRGPQRSSTLEAFVRAVCILIFVALLVTLLSVAIPEPPPTGDLAAPPPRSEIASLESFAVASARRKRGGVRGQAAYSSRLRRKEAGPASSPGISKRWDADTLELKEEEASPDTKSRTQIKKRIPLTKEEIEDEGAFGRKEDADAVEEESQDEEEEAQDEEGSEEEEEQGSDEQEESGEDGGENGDQTDGEQDEAESEEEEGEEAEADKRTDSDRGVHLVGRTRDRRERKGRDLPDGDEEATRESHDRERDDDAEAEVA